jgi:hypothetical protein
MNSFSETQALDSEIRPEVSATDAAQLLAASTNNHVSTAELKLAAIIEAARKIAVLAEEVLREAVTNSSSEQRSSLLGSSPEMALRLLTATEQQLNSLLVMSRKEKAL